MNPGHAQETSETDNMGNEANTQLLELQEAFMGALTNMGLVGKLKAQLRAVALGLLRGDQNLSLAAVGPTKSFACASIETQLSLLLINDFLVNNHLVHTAGVLEVEAGTPSYSNCAKDHVKNSIATLSGEGTMLERLIHLAINRDDASVSHLPSPPSIALPSPEPEEKPASTQDKVPFKAEETQKTLPELSGLKIYNEVMQYEESIPYSEEEGFLEEDYTEIELS